MYLTVAYRPENEMGWEWESAQKKQINVHFRDIQYLPPHPSTLVYRQTKVYSTSQLIMKCAKKE